MKIALVSILILAPLLCFQQVCAQNVFSSFLSFVQSKLNSPSEVSKIVQLEDSTVCLTNSKTTARIECFCSYKKLKQFERSCGSNFKKSQDDAKNCAEERCEYCCRLSQPQDSTVSILEYEMVCEKKCSKSDIILNLKEEEYRTVFKKIVEFIRVFFPPNTLSYYPMHNRAAKYSNKVIGPNTDQINEDLTKLSNDSATDITDNEDESEEKYSPYNEY